MSDEKPAGLDISKIKAFKKIELSDGEIYVRALSIDRIGLLDDQADKADHHAYGKALIRLSCFASEADENVDASFVESLLVSVKKDDLKLVCSAIASINGFELDAQADELIENLSIGYQERLKQLSRFASETVRKTFAALSDSTRFTLADSIAKLGGITAQLQKMSARNLIPNLGSTVASLKTQPFDLGVRAKVSGNETRPTQEAFPFDPDRTFESVKLPNIEDGPIGRSARAAEATAETMKELSELMAGMAAQIGIIASTITTDVLPAWQQSLKDGQDEANKSIAQSAESIKWTKWAFIGSIVVSVITCAVQVSQSAIYNGQGDVQQEKTMEMMQKQLDASLAMQHQLAADSAELRAQLKQIKAKDQKKTTR